MYLLHFEPEHPQIYERANLLSSGESVVAFCQEHDENVPPHIHDFYEIVVILEGVGEHMYGTERQALKAGDVLFINPLIPHAYFVDSGERLFLHNILFTEAALDGVATGAVSEMIGLFFDVSFLGAGVPRIRLPEQTSMHGAMDDPRNISGAMVEEYRLKRLSYQSILQGYLMVLLGSLRRLHRRNLPTVTKNTEVWKRLLPALRVVYRPEGVNLTLKEVAEKTGWSPDHFSRLFQQATGESFHRFMLRLRVHRAAMLILTSPWSLESIARQAGYTSARALRRAFVDEFEMTPGAFRSRYGR